MRAGGGLFGDHQLSRGGDLLFVCNHDSLVAYSTQTGEQAWRLQHAAPVTAVCLHPQHDSQLFAASRDGQLTLWDLSTGAPLREWDVGSPIESLAVLGTGDTAYLSCHWRQQQAGRLFAYDLAKGAAAATGRAKVAAAGRLVACASGELLATVDRHTALVWQADCFPQAPLAITHTKPLTCAALSSSGNVLAVGDATGRIMLWHGVQNAVQARVAAQRGALNAEAADHAFKQMDARATMHWHAEPVRCLAFTADDSYLLSGGHEGVLVVWDLSSGRRSYLPRLGTSLHGIVPCSSNPSRLAIRLSDNVVRMVDMAAMHVQASIRGICCSPVPPSTSCMAVQPGTGCLVLTSPSASLQFFDPLRNAHVDRLQLSYTRQVHIAQAGALSSGSSKGMAATHASFDAAGKVMVTVEQGTDMAGATTSQIKLWLRSQVGLYGGSYTLAAAAGNPCSIKDSVTAVVFAPTSSLVAAALGSGGICFFDVGSKATGAVPGRALPGCMVNALALSPDGTVLACGMTAQAPVVLLDVASRKLLAALPPACAAHSAIRHLGFLADGLHLAAEWDGGAAVYNLLTGRASWVAQLPTTLLAVDRKSAQLALGTHGSALVYMDAAGPLQQGLGLLHGLHVQAAQFNGEQGAPAQGALVVLNDARQFVATLPAEHAPFAAHEARRSSAGGPQPAGPAAAAPSAGAPERLRAEVAASCKHSASHLLARACDLCPAALEQLLL